MNHRLLALIFITGWMLSGVRAQPLADLQAVTPVLHSPLKTQISLRVGDRKLLVSREQYGPENGLYFINLHDNEYTSVQAAREVLPQTGGTLLKIENGRQRIIRFSVKGRSYRFDPNRMFSREGIIQSLRENGSRVHPQAVDAIEAFGQSCLALLPDSSRCVVALHNNTEAAFSIKTYLPGGSRESDARAVWSDSLQDEDDIIITTDSILYQHMADAGFNSIWQDPEKVRRDGSLSVYYAEKNGRYINIETQHGRKEQYVIMLKELMRLLTKNDGRQPEEDKQSPATGTQ